MASVGPRPLRGAVVAAIALAACGASGSRASDAPELRRARPSASHSAATSAPPSDAPPRPGDARAADPDASRSFLEHSEEPSVALASASKPPRVTALALENTARGEASGMSARGPVWIATLKEGERATTPIDLEPNECVTFIAEGGLGSIEVDLFLTIRKSGRIAVLAQDVARGPIAVIGGRVGCVRMGSEPIHAELSVRMRRGGGAVLVQGYRSPAAR